MTAAAGSLSLCLCHQTPACPKHNEQVEMEDTSTSPSPPTAGMASVDFREKASQHKCNSKIWGLLEGLHLTILGHAYLELEDRHEVIHLPMPSRKRQILSIATSHQQEDLAAYVLSFGKEDLVHPVPSL